ncbi:MAG: LpxI family protein, partial [Nitrospiraceae bacterium]
KRQALLQRLPVRNAETIFGAVAEDLGALGIEVLPASTFMEEHMPGSGVLTRRGPTRKERRDIEFGWEMAEAVGRLDIGQCVVVKDMVVVAVEAVEGSDEAIRRGGKLARGGAVVVKRFKPQQDRRFDLPAVGPGTIQAMIESGAAVLAIEAGKAVFLDREEAIEAADEAGITIVGVAR